MINKICDQKYQKPNLIVTSTTGALVEVFYGISMHILGGPSYVGGFMHAVIHRKYTTHQQCLNQINFSEIFKNCMSNWFAPSRLSLMPQLGLPVFFAVTF